MVGVPAAAEAAFMEQRAAYLKDREQSRVEEAQLQGQKKQAAEQLRELINGEHRPVVRTMEAMESSENVRAWQELISDAKMDEDAEAEGDPWLQAALHATAAGVTMDQSAYKQHVSAWLEKQCAEVSPTPGVTTPQRGVTQGLPMTPKGKPMATPRMPVANVGGQGQAGSMGLGEPSPGVLTASSTYLGGAEPAVRDPYMMSPSAPVGHVTPARTTFGKAGDRMSVKAATMHTRGTDKRPSRSVSPSNAGHVHQVEAKRAALTQQLQVSGRIPIILHDDGGDNSVVPLVVTTGVAAVQSGSFEDLTRLE